MKIEFVRTGGFAGLRFARTFDTGALPAPQAQKVVQLVQGANFFEMPDPATPEKAVPDSYEYRISVSSSTQTRAVVVSETTMPQQLRPLVDYLVSLIKSGD